MALRKAHLRLFANCYLHAITKNIWDSRVKSQTIIKVTFCLFAHAYLALTGTCNLPTCCSPPCRRRNSPIFSANASTKAPYRIQWFSFSFICTNRTALPNSSWVGTVCPFHNKSSPSKLLQAFSHIFSFYSDDNFTHSSFFFHVHDNNIHMRFQYFCKVNGFSHPYISFNS